MAISKTLFGTARLIPETDEVDWGGEVTNQLDDLIDQADGLAFLIGSVINLYFKSVSNTLAAGATLTQTHPRHKVQGSGGPVTISSISAGTKDGALLILQGDHATNTVTILDNAGTKMNGLCTLEYCRFLVLIWDSTAGYWLEVCRTS